MWCWQRVSLMIQNQSKASHSPWHAPSLPLHFALCIQRPWIKPRKASLPVIPSLYNSPASLISTRHSSPPSTIHQPLFFSVFFFFFFNFLFFSLVFPIQCSGFTTPFEFDSASIVPEIPLLTYGEEVNLIFLIPLFNLYLLYVKTIIFTYLVFTWRDWVFGVGCWIL